MPRISGAKIPADLRNISFDPLLDNSSPEYIIGPGDTVEILFLSDSNVDRITSRGLKLIVEVKSSFHILEDTTLVVLLHLKQKNY